MPVICPILVGKTAVIHGQGCKSSIKSSSRRLLVCAEFLKRWVLLDRQMEEDE